MRLLLHPVRFRFCSGLVLLLLLGLSVCVFLQTRTRLRSGPHEKVLMEESSRIISSLEALQKGVQSKRQALVLTGLHPPSDPELQLILRVLTEMKFTVDTSPYAETSNTLRTQHGVSGWSLLMCLSSSERSCLRRIPFTHLTANQRVNLLPAVMEAFSDAGGGLCLFYARSHLTGTQLPMRPQACGSTNQKLPLPADSPSPAGAPPPVLVAMVNVYILVTSVRPLTSFLHDISVVTTNQERRGRPTQLTHFLQQTLGPHTSHDALQQIKRVIGEVLHAAVSTTKEQHTSRGCVLCFQLLTFTLLFSGSITPVVVQVDTDLTFSALTNEAFEGPISRDRILEDTLHFLHLSSAETQYGGCRGTHGVCLSEDEFLLLLQFQQQMKTSSAFQLLYPSSSSSSSSSSLLLSDLLIRISRHYELQRNQSSRIKEMERTNQNTVSDGTGACVDPRLRQLYLSPPLGLTPPFSPSVREYWTEVTFDQLTVRVRPETLSPACSAHLDHCAGPSMAIFPLGLGDSSINILVTGGGEKPAVMATYSVHVHRDSRPSLPMFGDHVTCSFLQDCGLVVQPVLPCGLQPFIRTPSPSPTCSSGDHPGVWVVPCLTCSDNRTCDWREVTWQPNGCYHPQVPPPPAASLSDGQEGAVHRGLH
ncbi:hypothetical protein PBY51_009140 [Eleginops maclovinus]|uniref:Cadherin-like beta sandwich domain-containing protein n=1 Tax=Eleginops maclovinus TaxID=56733 RepID=A0AAN7WVG7_ELEMC|nr:hypothetical protein PBY51_009140 [Eleginops maclovinus]